ncbi:MAG: hypothetical protein HFACDABA_02486 [Anaerolineales bacterium]|nr:hypothetical protein [Anaerolineales bacterium]
MFIIPLQISVPKSREYFMSKTLPNKACTGLVGTVRLLEHYQRPEHFSARRASLRPAHKPVTQTVGRTSHNYR